VQSIAEFDEKLKSGEISEKEGAFWEEISSGTSNRLVGRLTYSEWLLEKILLSLTWISAHLVTMN
jgi:hypothetical protein